MKYLTGMSRLVACAAVSLTAICLPAAGEAAAADTGPTLVEIIVTAQKVAEPASKTPIALTAISGEALQTAGITDARGLTELAPSVQIGQESRHLEINIRGVMSRENSEIGDPSAAFHVDGAYIGRPEGQLGSFFDLERVEVLRGPQGTLYGRNATAGAINVITAKPTDKLAGKASVEFGDFGTVRTNAMLNVPVTDNFWLRAAFSTNKHDSYINPGPLNGGLKDFYSQDDYAGRVHGFLKFTDTTTLLLTLEGGHQGGGGNTPVPIANFFPAAAGGNVAISSGNNIAGPGTVIDAGGQTTSVTNPIYVDRGKGYQQTAWAPFPIGFDNTASIRTRAVRSEFKTEGLGFAALTYQFAYLDLDIKIPTVGSYFSFPFSGLTTGGSHQTSHELRLNSISEGRFKWVAGLFHFNESIGANSVEYQTFTPFPFPSPGHPNLGFPALGEFGTVALDYRPAVQNKSSAVFGQATYSLTDTFRLTAGARYTKDEKSKQDPINGGGTPIDATVSFTKTTGKVGFEWDAAHATMVYAGVATGYKAGGFSTDQASEAVIYQPETLTSIEGGIKSKLLDDTLQINAAVFHYDYKNLQLSSVVCTRPNDPSSCGSLTTNAAKAKVTGIEVDGRYAVTEHGTIDFTAAHLDAKFDRYVITQFNTAQNSVVQIADFSNQQLDRAAKDIFALAYTHTFPLANGSSFSAHLGSRYNSGYFISDPADGVRYKQPNFHKSDAYIGYTGPSGDWSAQVFMKNIENYITIESRVPGTFAIGDPRTVGARFSVSF